MPDFLLAAEADLVKRVGDAETLGRYSSSSEDNVLEAIAVATDMFRSAAANRYTDESILELTPTTCPKEAKAHIVSLALDFLTAGGQGRPDSIKEYADLARDYLKYLVAGTAHVAALTPITTSVSDADGNSNVSYRMPRERVFDRDATSAAYAVRNPKI